MGKCSVSVTRWAVAAARCNRMDPGSDTAHPTDIIVSQRHALLAIRAAGSLFVYIPPLRPVSLSPHPQGLNAQDAILPLRRCFCPGNPSPFPPHILVLTHPLQFTHYTFNRHEPTTPQPVLVTIFSVPSIWSLLFVYRSASLISATLFSFSTYFSVLAISIAAYRLSPFHPLASFPGTTISKLTKWWGVWETYDGHHYIRVHELHKKYGPIVRVGPNELSIADVTAISAVLGSCGLPKGHCMRRLIHFLPFLTFAHLHFS